MIEAINCVHIMSAIYTISISPLLYLFFKFSSSPNITSPTVVFYGNMSIVLLHLKSYCISVGGTGCS